MHTLYCANMTHNRFGFTHIIHDTTQRTQYVKHNKHIKDIK